jgi:hypothetical protein
MSEIHSPTASRRNLLMGGAAYGAVALSHNALGQDGTWR